MNSIHYRCPFVCVVFAVRQEAAAKLELKTALTNRAARLASDAARQEQEARALEHEVRTHAPTRAAHTRVQTPLLRHVRNTHVYKRAC